MPGFGFCATIRVFVTEDFHRLRRAFAQAGLKADDASCCPRLSEDEFLRLTRRADVILDSINGR